MLNRKKGIMGIKGFKEFVGSYEDLDVSAAMTALQAIIAYSEILPQYLKTLFARDKRGEVVGFNVREMDQFINPSPIEIPGMNEENEFALYEAVTEAISIFCSDSTPPSDSK